MLSSHAFLPLLKRPVVHALAAVYIAYMFASVRLVCIASPCNISGVTGGGRNCLTGRRGRGRLLTCSLGLYAPHPQVLVLRRAGQQQMPCTCIMHQLLFAHQIASHKHALLLMVCPGDGC